jgi:hypothetical protein
MFSVFSPGTQFGTFGSVGFSTSSYASGVDWIFPASSVGSTTVGTYCDGVENGFFKSACNFAGFMFVPKVPFSAHFEELKGSVMSRFPFVFFTVYSNSLDQLRLTYSDVETTVSIPFRENGTTSPLVLINTSVVRNLGVISEIRTVIGYLMYFIFALFVISRVTKFF